MTDKHTITETVGVIGTKIGQRTECASGNHNPCPADNSYNYYSYVYPSWASDIKFSTEKSQQVFFRLQSKGYHSRRLAALAAEEPDSVPAAARLGSDESRQAAG